MHSKARLRKKLELKKKPPKTISEEVSSADESSKEDEAKGAHIKIDYKRIGIRCVIIVAIIAVVNFTQGNKLETFASEKEEIKHKDATFECSPDFLKSVKRFPGCVPKKCGRFVTDTPISLSEVQALSLIAQKVFSSKAESVGTESEYSTFDMDSGILTKGNSVVNVYKNDNTHKVVTSEDLKIYRFITDKIKAVIVEQFGLTSQSVYLAQPTFFTHIDPLYSDALHPLEYWSPHVDKDKFPSSAYTAHLFLTDYDFHFKGGRLVFVDNGVNKTVEPKVGRVTAFTSGSENVNYMEQVMSGTRLAVTITFTCDPKKDIKEFKFRS